jgi:DNA-binding MarR family transcriptional regulator
VVRGVKSRRKRRAKLIVLTRKGKACVEAGRSPSKELEDEITR